MNTIRIGTAGWSIPRQASEAFPKTGSGLERYASRLDVVEINSSFYRSHRCSTWSRWRDNTPDTFRFSVKLPKLITHHRKLIGCSNLVETFLEEVLELGRKLAVILVQLPPKLAFNGDVAGPFFEFLISRSSTYIACEPRHPGWFTTEANALFERLGVSRVAADPAICPAAAQPGGWPGLRYWRLHGSPDMYRSSYSDRLGALAPALIEASTPDQETWCIFDNTASGAAVSDALSLAQLFART